MSKYYLEVPREEKDDAKALGARWDPKALRWWCPRGSEATFARWDPRRCELPGGCGADPGSVTAVVRLWQQLVGWHSKAYGHTDQRAPFFEEDPEEETTWGDMFRSAAGAIASVVQRHDPDLYCLSDGSAIRAYVLDEVFDGGGFGSANDLRFDSPYGSSYFSAAWVAEARQCPRYLSDIGASDGLENYPVDFEDTTVLLVTPDLALFPAERHVVSVDWTVDGQRETFELMDVVKPTKEAARLHDEGWTVLLDLANLWCDWDERDGIGYRPREAALLMGPRQYEREVSRRQMHDLGRPEARGQRPVQGRD